jgi:hypothetical protein
MRCSVFTTTSPQRASNACSCAQLSTKKKQLAYILYTYALQVKYVFYKSIQYLLKS